jgi:hypothetical protein
MNYKNIHIIALLGSAILFYACNKTETINTNSTQASTNHLLLNSESKENALLHIEFSLNTHFKNNITGVGDFINLKEKISIDNDDNVSQQNKQQAFNNIYDKIDSIKNSLISENRIIQFIDVEFSIQNNKTNGPENLLVAAVYSTAASIPSAFCPENENSTFYDVAAGKLNEKLNDPVCNEKVTPVPDARNFKKVAFIDGDGRSHIYENDWVFSGGNGNISKTKMDHYLDRWANEVTNDLHPESPVTGEINEGYVPQLYHVDYTFTTGKVNSFKIHHGGITYGLSISHLPRELFRCC